LLGLVPILAVFLAILGAFPAIENLREDVKEMIMVPFAPAAGDVVQEHLNQFLENTKRLGVFGAVGVGVTALLMLNTIETTLNGVWRVTERRAVRQRILIFWALLTLPLILIAASLSLSSYFFAIASQVEVFGVIDAVKRLTPLLMQTVAF
jgi:membrane protein